MFRRYFKKHGIQGVALLVAVVLLGLPHTG